MSRPLIVIPARATSTRLPGKLLLAESGRPLIAHTIARALAVPGADVLVACDHPDLLAAARAAGAEVVMTSPDHRSGTDRIAEAARGRTASVVVNVQGDEPEIEPGAITHLIDTHLASGGAAAPFASTLVCPFPNGTDPDRPDAVKAVLSLPSADGARRALWFSRARLPFQRTEDAAPLYLHLGIYAFRPESLQAFPALPRTPAERAESLEQLRILEHGHRIGAGVVEGAYPGIDTRADYDAFLARCR